MTMPLPLSGRTRIFVDAYMTCLARVELYKSLGKLGERALYFHTDSVIYCWQPAQADIPLLDFLSDMTNELDD